MLIRRLAMILVVVNMESWNSSRSVEYPWINPVDQLLPVRAVHMSVDWPLRGGAEGPVITSILTKTWFCAILVTFPDLIFFGCYPRQN